jgi:hypothetical protein
MFNRLNLLASLNLLEKTRLHEAVGEKKSKGAGLFDLFLRA